MTDATTEALFAAVFGAVADAPAADPGVSPDVSSDASCKPVAAAFVPAAPEDGSSPDLRSTSASPRAPDADSPQTTGSASRSVPGQSTMAASTSPAAGTDAPVAPVTPLQPPAPASPALPGQGHAPAGPSCPTTPVSATGGGASATDARAVLEDAVRATMDRAWLRLTSHVPARLLSGTDDAGARPD